MASAVACTAARPVAALAPAAKAQRVAISKPCVSRQFLAARPAPKAQRQAAVQTRALAEVAQLAEVEAGFIFGVSGVMVGITLIGLALGFVLLRVESLAEEGKI
ncbi:hypothetical protein ABPG75_012803 [Micractinium tetrahymenae]